MVDIMNVTGNNTGFFNTVSSSTDGGMYIFWTMLILVIMGIFMLLWYRQYRLEKAINQEIKDRIEFDRKMYTVMKTNFNKIVRENDFQQDKEQ